MVYKKRYNESEVTEHWIEPCCLVKKYFFGLIKITGEPISGVVYSKLGHDMYQEIEFSNGKKNGTWKQVNNSGIVVSESNFKDGKKNGVEIERWSNGILRSEENYKNLSHGVCKYTRMVN